VSEVRPVKDTMASVGRDLRRHHATAIPSTAAAKTTPAGDPSAEAETHRKKMQMGCNAISVNKSTNLTSFTNF